VGGEIGFSATSINGDNMAEVQPSFGSSEGAPKDMNYAATAINRPEAPLRSFPSYFGRRGEGEGHPKRSVKLGGDQQVKSPEASQTKVDFAQQ